MLDLLSRAKNAIEAYNSQLRINSSNIANMSVPGYKTMKVSFQSIYEQLINGGSAASGDIGGKNPIQFGSSVGISNISIDFSQGQFTAGSNMDLAINGNGLFLVSPDDGTTMLYTRGGKFHVDSGGNLVTDSGLQVYGSSGGGIVPIKGLEVYDPTRLSWTNDGKLVEYNNTNWTETDPALHYVTHDTGYSIALTSFNNLSGLAQALGNSFSETSASGPALANDVPGGTYGSIAPRFFEGSNVIYTSEVIDSMEAQRAMSANLTFVRLINDEITNFINRIS